MMRKVLSVAMALLLVCAMPLSVLADEWDLAVGDITVSVNESGTQNVEQNAASREDSNPTISSGSQTSNTITVSTAEGQTANITIDNVNINADSGNGIDVGDSNLNLTVKGENTINTSGTNDAAIHVSSGDLTITGDGKLDVTSVEDAAAIGSDNGENMSGDITIQGKATVNATSGDDGAGIGSGYEGEMSGNITIQGDATVNAESDDDGAGIGSGYYGKMSGDITIRGNSKVTTTNGEYDYKDEGGIVTGASIGSGGWGVANGTIRIGSNATLTMNGGTGIGAGTHGELGEKFAVIYFEEATAGEASAENETARPLYRVVDKDEKDLPYTETRKDGVLTVHCDRELATFLAKTADLRTLKSQGIHTIVFETEDATSTFALEDLLKEGTGTCRLTHDGKTVTFMLDDADISDILK